jgi:hypothetical protein
MPAALDTRTSGIQAGLPEEIAPSKKAREPLHPERLALNGNLSASPFRWSRNAVT